MHTISIVIERPPDSRASRILLLFGRQQTGDTDLPLVI
jgi:hypothetical protein